MQQYLTLEEAAKMLNITPDELREMAKKKTIRAFQDRGSWRFRAQDIEELARKRGIGSDPEVRLVDDLDSKKPGPPSSDRLKPDFDLDDDEVPLGKEKTSGSRSKSKSPPPGKSSSDSDVRLVLDSDLQLDAASDVKIEPSGPKSAPKSGSKSGPKSPGRKSKVDQDESGVRLVDAKDPSDSDVKVVPSGKDSDVKKKSKSPSDSDIRLQDLPSGARKKPGSEESVVTEEIDLDAEEARLAERNKDKGKKKGKGRPATMVANSAELPSEISDPDLDLDKPTQAPTKKKKSEVDSSSDFELVAFDKSKSPGAGSSGEFPILTEDEDVNLSSEVAGGRSAQSGINLQKPIDSGISLESGGSDEIPFDLSEEAGMTPKPKPAAPRPEDDSSSEFELSLDDSDESSSSSEFELSVESDVSSSSEFELSLDSSDGSSDLATTEQPSDSEFELTLDEEGGLAASDDEGKDIFEETNFDVPALDDDSGSEAVAIDEGDTDLEGSDFEISLDEDSSTGDESGSEVVSLDEDEEVDEGAATIAKPREKKSKLAAGIDAEEAPTLARKPAAKKSTKGLLSSGEVDVSWDVEEGSSAEVAEETADQEEDEAFPARQAAPAKEWGALPVIMLFPTVVVLFVVSLMGFELVRGMWGYHRPSPVGRPIIDTIARGIDDTLPK